jgi:hypothetical protein
MKKYSRTHVTLLTLLVAACGGATAQPTTGGDGGPDARADGFVPGDDGGGPGLDGAPSDGAPVDSPGDAPAYLACMDSSGQVSASLKACQSDSDCVIKQELTDCCGTILYVGIAKGSAAEFDACETAWEAHFPPCGCASNVTKTEDGKSSTLFADAAAPQVHCTNLTTSGGICMTYTP